MMWTLVPVLLSSYASSSRSTADSLRCNIAIFRPREYIFSHKTHTLDVSDAVIFAKYILLAEFNNSEEKPWNFY